MGVLARYAKLVNQDPVAGEACLRICFYGLKNHHITINDEVDDILL